MGDIGELWNAVKAKSGQLIETRDYIDPSRGGKRKQHF